MKQLVDNAQKCAGQANATDNHSDTVQGKAVPQMRRGVVLAQKLERRAKYSKDSLLAKYFKTRAKLPT